MTSDKVDELRQDLRRLYEEYWRKEVPRRRFDRLQAEKSVKLYRAIVAEQLEEDESILREHHVVRSHLRLSQSVLKEPEQEVTSLFLTERRLLRLRSAVMPGQAAAGDASDQTAVDGIQLDQIAALNVRKELRFGEAAAGVVICAVAYLFHSWLMVTGSLLFVLGLLGILHGLLIPTKWIELEIDGAKPDNGMEIYALRKKSARLLLRALRERMKLFPHDQQGK
jgi:hypothetical protein